MSLTIRGLTATRSNGNTAPHTNGATTPSLLHHDVDELNAHIEVDAAFLQELLGEVNKVMAKFS